MTLEDIITRIKQDAHKRSESEVADARDKATTFRREFEKELEQKKQSLQREMESAIQSKASIVISDANREVRDSILRIKESIIQECINEALDTLRDLPEDQHRDLLLSLVNQARLQLGGQCIVAFTRTKDKELMTGIPGFECSDEIVPGTGGIVAFSMDRKLRVNNTFEGILQRKRGEIRNLAARRLFS